MPQSTLLGWLSRPVAQRMSGPTKAVQEEQDKETTPREQRASEGNVRSAETKHIRDAAGSPGKSDDRSDHSIPSNVECRSCAKDDIKNLKQLTSLLLPIQYPDKFYREIIEDRVTNDITLVAIWHDNSDTSKKDGVLIGAIRCRLLAYPPSPDPTSAHKKQGPMLYLSTLVLLSPYRRYGIATHMLNMLTKRAVQEYGITSVGAHVWQANAEGLEWYRKRGFREVTREEGYYRRLNPTTAVVMQRQVGVMDLVGG